VYVSDHPFSVFPILFRADISIILALDDLTCHGLESLLPHVQWHLTSGETMLPFLLLQCRMQ
jgi:hypothetical protein